MSKVVRRLESDFEKQMSCALISSHTVIILDASVTVKDC